MYRGYIEAPASTPLVRNADKESARDIRRGNIVRIFVMSMGIHHLAAICLLGNLSHQVKTQVTALFSGRGNEFLRTAKQVNTRNFAAGSGCNGLREALCRGDSRFAPFGRCRKCYQAPSDDPCVSCLGFLKFCSFGLAPSLSTLCLYPAQCQHRFKHCFSFVRPLPGLIRWS